ncbi:hypothetical protein NLG97_g8056 [Lecanicillium saksenae]|uniref:Uncharacterized protein n=1 Tax=Lecanicillium saksenae TaxID=468837 RepID=A0ACC1QK29_9HYPO|nr:hypothetical protein NLG97_g8056 [Lecanicillium saksenae]
MQEGYRAGCSTLQHIAAHCSALQRPTAGYGNATAAYLNRAGACVRALCYSGPASLGRYPPARFGGGGATAAAAATAAAGWLPWLASSGCHDSQLAAITIPTAALHRRRARHPYRLCRARIRLERQF